MPTRSMKGLPAHARICENLVGLLWGDLDQFFRAVCQFRRGGRQGQKQVDKKELRGDQRLYRFHDIFPL
jgi:hypothetical protein